MLFHRFGAAARPIKVTARTKVGICSLGNGNSVINLRNRHCAPRLYPLRDVSSGCAVAKQWALGSGTQVKRESARTMYAILRTHTPEIARRGVTARRDRMAFEGLKFTHLEQRAPRGRDVVSCQRSTRLMSPLEIAVAFRSNN